MVVTVTCLKQNRLSVVHSVAAVLYLQSVLHVVLFRPRNVFCTLHWGTRWRSWLRHCATSRKVAGSIPDGVIGIFQLHNHSGRTMALGSTQPLTEMSTRKISWGVKAAGA